jgi:flagellar protein FlaG
MVNIFPQLGALATTAPTHSNTSNALPNAELDASTVITPPLRPFVPITASLESNSDLAQQAKTFDQLTTAVDKINDRLLESKQTLSFALDDESGRMVIRLTDTTTNEVIRQIPSEEALKFTQYIDEYADALVGLLLQQKA